MKNIPMLLLDSDFIIALGYPKESTHKKALELSEKYFSNENLFYLDLVLYEVANVLSRKYSQQEAIKMTKKLRENKTAILKLTPEQEEKAWDLFYLQKNKGASFVDCANSIAADVFCLEVLSFDKFYTSRVK